VNPSCLRSLFSGKTIIITEAFTESATSSCQLKPTTRLIMMSIEIIKLSAKEASQRDVVTQDGCERDFNQWLDYLKLV
jgi:hypothetical protein